MTKSTLPEHLKKHMRDGGFAALYVAGPKVVVAKRLGDNRGCRPIKIGITTAWVDTISNNLDGASALYPQGVLFRLWCSNTGRAKFLEMQIGGYIAKHSDPLRKAWCDLGPDLNIVRFQKAIRQVATDHGIVTWSDGELIDYLRSMDTSVARRIKRAYA
jgi:hypothetical protein